MRNPRSASRVLLVVTVLLSLLLATALPASAVPWQWADPLPTGAELHGVAFGNNRFVAVGEAGTLLTSPDGITWTTGKTGTDLTLQAVAYGNGAFVAVAGEPLPDRWAILSSPDGLTWQQAAAGTGYELYGILYAEGRFLAVGGRLAGCSESAGLLLASTDGQAWQDLTWKDAPPLLAIAYGAGRYVATGPCDPAISTSADGTHWATALSGGNTLWDRRDVAYGGGRFLSTAALGPSLQSSDGQHWTNLDTGNPRGGQGPEYGAGQVIRYVGGRFITAHGSSADGATWMPHEIGIMPAGFGPNDVAYGNSTYVAVGRDLIATSPDGQIWTSQVKRMSHGWSGIVAGGGEYVAIGYDGVISTSADGRTWQQRTFPDPNADGGVAAFTIPNLNDVAYGGGTFVAVGSPSFLVLTSTDHGATWTRSQQWTGEYVQGYIQLTAVAYGGGTFVAVGSAPPGQSQTIASSDGVHWSHSDLFPGVTLTGVAYDGQRFLAVGWMPESLRGVAWASPDGISWTPLTVDLPPLWTVAYFQGQFVAIGNDQVGDIQSYAFTSPDGGAWQQTRLPGNVGITHLSEAGGFLFVPGGLHLSRDGHNWGTLRLPTEVRAVAGVGNQLVALGPDAILTLNRCGTFPDLAADDPACPAVTALQDRRAVSGYPDGTFRPDSPVTRAEFTKMLAVALGRQPVPGAPLPFSDTAGHWAALQGYLQAIAAQNAVSGYPDGTFRPNAPVTRAELIKIAATVAGLLPGAPAPYADVTPADWFAGPVSAAATAGLTGPHAPTPLWTDAKLQPGQSATRSETAILLANLILLLNSRTGPAAAAPIR